MPELRFTQSHEWVRLEGDVATIGITDHAQNALGDVVFVDLPEAGREVAAGEACAVVESVKAASDVYAPVAGRVTETNAALSENPALINSSPTGEGWFFRLEGVDAAAVAALMDEAAYASFVESQS
jgi:glycine cleavage system H protein